LECGRNDEPGDQNRAAGRHRRVRAAARRAWAFQGWGLGVNGLVDPGGTLFGWFRDAARAHPDRPAIEVGGTSCRYRELLDLVERLAGRMAHAAGRPPRRIGLLLPRGLDAYAAYLATLRLGATVVPLNPAFPAGRSRAVCHATGVDLLVADAAGAAAAEEIRAGTPCGTVVLGPGDAEGDRAATTLPPYSGDPDDVAYILFTSGSTGVPKGVPVRHRNACPCIAYSAERYGVGPGDRVSHAFDLTFDPSVIDMFMALGTGATLVVLEPDDLLTPARVVAAKGITHWNSVPSVISIARRLRTLPPGSMPSLRWAVFGGEQLRFDQVEAWLAAAPRCAVDNVYGPTELAINCALYRVPSDRRQWPRTPNGTVPIGRIHPHLHALIVAEDGTEAETGELCVRGPQRFDGYLDPARNAGRFLRFDGRVASPAYPGGAELERGDRRDAGRLEPPAVGRLQPRPAEQLPGRDGLDHLVASPRHMQSERDRPRLEQPEPVGRSALDEDALPAGKRRPRRELGQLLPHRRSEAGQHGVCVHPGRRPGRRGSGHRASSPWA
jgi:non-ribosomal peptide synthetase component F